MIPAGRRRPIIGLAALGGAIVLLGAPGAGRGGSPDGRAAGSRPGIFAVSPPEGASGVSPITFVATELHLPNAGAGVERKTLGADSVHLTRASDGQRVPATVNTSGGRDVIVLKPTAPLAPHTRYLFTVTDRVQDKNGTPFLPFTSTFTTGEAPPPVTARFAFQKVALPASDGRDYTSVTIGPDRRLYAATLTGEIVRFALGEQGVLGAPEVISSLVKAAGRPRCIIGVTFDPRSTARDLVLWVTHGPEDLKTAPDWEGRLSRLSGPALERVQDYLVGLPQSIGHHRTNSIAFRPGEPGILYFAQGSTSAMGAPDGPWGNRPEHLLSAAILRLDVGKVKAPPLDVRTEEGGTYDPFARGAPLTIFATGVRNAYDLVWHSNGRLYVPSNGSAAWGNTPATPFPLPASCAARIDRRLAGAYRGPAVAGIEGVTVAQSDYLFRVVQGGYYGHPNPTRCEWVMDGGNPGPGPDRAEVHQYPVGTRPDRNWRGASFDFGRHYSPNGIIEYRSKVFGPALEGKLLVARYSGGDDIVALGLDPVSGEVRAAEQNAVGLTGFSDPLDLVEDVSTGSLYVSEHGARRITLLRPRPERASPGDRSGDVAWTPLFDGKSLAGWIQRGGTASFAVQLGADGKPMIVGTSAPPPSPSSFLCTEQSFGDFVLEYEFKADPGFNSGVQFRGQVNPAFHQGKVYGYQVEIDPDVKLNRLWTGGIFDEGRRGWLASLEHNEPARRAFRPEQWNHVRVEVEGDSMRTWVNGVPAADLVDSVDLAGFIALQVHHVRKPEEILHVAWRDLRIKDLGHSEWRPIFDGRTLRGFRARGGRFTVEDGALLGVAAGRGARLETAAPVAGDVVRAEYRLSGGAAALYLQAPAQGDGVDGKKVDLDAGDGGWRQVTVSAHGGRRVVHLDGKVVSDAADGGGAARGRRPQRLAFALSAGARLEVRRLERLAGGAQAQNRSAQMAKR